MATQPIKNSVNYEKFFSNEIKDFLQNVVLDVAQNEVPANAIYPEIFFIAALTYPDCMLYKVVNGYLTTMRIDEMCDKLLLYAQDKFALSSARPKRTIDFSPEMKSLFQKANRERDEAGHEHLTTDHVLLALLNEKTKAYDFLQELFSLEHLTYEIAKEASAKLHETTSAIAAYENEAELNDILRDYIIGVDTGITKDADHIIITGTLPDGVDTNDVTKKITEVFSGFSLAGKEASSEPKGKSAQKKTLTYSKNLNEAAEKGQIDPIVGRKKEIDKIAKVFERRRCNNALLVGEPGVGKTAVVEGMAKQIIDGNSPASIKNCKIFQLNYSDMMAGTQFRGVFEERLSNFIKEINKIPNAILFIDNIHNIFSDRQKNDYDFAGIFSAMFNEAKVKVIATITPKGYHNTFEGDGELQRRFQKITIEKPSKQECIDILNSNKEYYEAYHGVKYSDEAIEACVTLAEKYLTDRNLPSSAIDVLDEVGADKKISLLEPESVRKKRNAIAIFKHEKERFIKEDNISEATNTDRKINGLKIEIANEMSAFSNPMKTPDNIVNVDDVNKVVSEMTNIPIQKVTASEKKFLSTINDTLKKCIIGQDEAIDVVSRAIKRNKIGLSPVNRPIFSCICIGSTGTGKTLLAKKLAQEIFGDEKYLVRFDMSEYSDKTAVNKLIGASAGYVGYSEGGLLTEAVKNKKHAVLLIDEIEKADEEIFNLFLQILDEGMLTDNTGQKVDFKNTILILTSNVGAKRAANEKGIGFAVNDSVNRKSIIEKELKNKFPPEFINRLDEIVYFNDLTDDNLKDIVKLEIGKLQEKITLIGHTLNYTDDVVDYIFNIVSKQKEYGARPILRTIQKEIENRITDLIIDNDYEHHTFDATCTNDEKKLEIK